MEVVEVTVYRLLASLGVAAVFVVAASACISDGETEVVYESDAEAVELLAAAGSRLSGRAVRGDATFAFDEAEWGPADVLTSSFESDSQGRVSTVVVLKTGTSLVLPDGGVVEVRYLDSGAYVRLAAAAEGEGGGIWYMMTPPLLLFRWPAGQFFGLEGPVGSLMCVLFPHFKPPVAEGCNLLADAAAVLELASGVHAEADEAGRVEEVTRVAFVLPLEELFPPVARIRAQVMEEGHTGEGWSRFLDWLGSDVEAEAWIDAVGDLRRLELDLSLLFGEASLEPDSMLEMTLTIDLYDFDAADIVVEAPSSVVDAPLPDLDVRNYGNDPVAEPKSAVSEAQT